MFYIFCSITLLVCGEKNILPNLTNRFGEGDNIPCYTWLKAPCGCCCCGPGTSAMEAAKAAARASSSDSPAWKAVACLAAAGLPAADGRLLAAVGWLLEAVGCTGPVLKGPEKKFEILDWVLWPARLAAAAAALEAAADAACLAAAAAPSQLWSFGCRWVRQKVSLHASHTILI